MERPEKKKSLGRRKIEIKKIENKNNLLVTFSKRRKGLIKKAGELSILCGADVAVIVQSPAGRIHAFGNVPVESIIDRYLHRNSHPTCLSNYHKNNNNYEDDAAAAADRFQVQDENEKKCLEILKKLEAEKDVEKSLEESNKICSSYNIAAASSSRGGGGGGGLSWWDQPFDDLDLIELEQYTNAMEALKNNVMNRADEKAAARAINNIDVLIPNLAVDCFGGAPVPHIADFISTNSTISKPLMLFNPNPST